MYDIRAASSQCAAQVTASQVPQPLYVSICQHMSAYVKSVCGSSNGESGATSSVTSSAYMYCAGRVTASQVPEAVAPGQVPEAVAPDSASVRAPAD
jgi:hypothetical protein